MEGTQHPLLSPKVLKTEISSVQLWKITTQTSTFSRKSEVVDPKWVEVLLWNPENPTQAQSDILHLPTIPC